jgi:excisionase family DNA binding protein
VLGLVPQLIDLRARDAAPRVPPGGTPVLAASKLLRHATTEVTEKVYTAVDPRWLRAQVNRMPLDLSRLAPQVDEKWKIHPDGTKTTKPPTSPKHSSGEIGDFRARDTGFEPVAFGSGGGGEPIQRGPAALNPSQSLLRPQLAGPGCSPKSAARAAPVLRRLRAVPGPLLSVRAVAEALGMSRATVCAMVERGEIPHVRLTTNGIRVRPADLAAFVQSRTYSAT